MKGFAFVLLCALVAVQGRSTAVQKSTREVASLGDNPWVVHLRIAISTSGLLETCVGSLLRNNYVLTAYKCMSDTRYIWIRYGVVSVITPSLVTENSINVVNKDLALININRIIVPSVNYSPMILSDEGVSESGSVCAFGITSDGAPGETLSCYSVNMETQEDGSVVVNNDELEITKFDLGASVVSNGVQVGVITGVACDSYSGVVTPVADYLAWIEEQTGLNQASEIILEAEVAPEVV